MQRDYLERFILASREAFDDATPSLDVWAEIDERLSRRPGLRVTLWRALRIAAGVLALLFTGAVAGRYLAGTGEEATTAALSEVAPEVLEMARYYEEEITRKEQRLATYHQGQSVLADFEQLDRSMEELKRELLHAPKSKEEQIIENLIRTYQTKVDILERVLERIQTTSEPNIIKPADDEISI